MQSMQACTKQCTNTHTCMVTCCWVAAVLLLLLLLLLSAALLGGPLVAVWYARQLARLARQRLASVEVGVLHAHKQLQSRHAHC
jgi:NADH:ubiquinone oxidoreductase subunit H